MFLQDKPVPPPIVIPNPWIKDSETQYRLFSVNKLCYQLSSNPPISDLQLRFTFAQFFEVHLRYNTASVVSIAMDSPTELSNYTWTLSGVLYSTLGNRSGIVNITAGALGYTRDLFAGKRTSFNVSLRISPGFEKIIFKFNVPIVGINDDPTIQNLMLTR